MNAVYTDTVTMYTGNTTKGEDLQLIRTMSAVEKGDGMMTSSDIKKGDGGNGMNHL